MATRSVDVVIRARDQASRQLKTVGRSAGGLKTSLFSLKTAAVAAGVAMAAMVTVAVIRGMRVLVQGLRSAVSEASNAVEIASKFAAVFGVETEKANRFVQELTVSIGRSKLALQEGMATFQSFFVGLGYGGDEARRLSQNMQALSIDFASFHNLSDDEALQRFISAMSGSSEVLDRFGINIKMAALNQEFLRMGIQKTTAQATEQEKVTARINVVMRAMTMQGAVGDAVRTAGSFANQIKALQGRLRDMSAEIGGALLPAITPFVDLLKNAIPTFKGWGISLAESVQAAVQVAGRAGGAIKSIWRSVAAVVRTAFAVLSNVLEDWGVNLTSVGDVVRKVAEGIAEKFQWLAKGIVWDLTVAEVAVLHWRDVLRLGLLGAKLAIVSFVEDVKHLYLVILPAAIKRGAQEWLRMQQDMVFKHLPALLKIMVKNWVAALEAQAKALLRFGKWIATGGWLRGVRLGLDFQIEFARAITGAIQTMPETLRRGLSAAESDLMKEIGAISQKLGDEFNRKMQERMGWFRMRPGRIEPGAPGAAAPGAAPGAEEERRRFLPWVQWGEAIKEALTDSADSWLERINAGLGGVAVGRVGRPAFMEQRFLQRAPGADPILVETKKAGDQRKQQITVLEKIQEAVEKPVSLPWAPADLTGAGGLPWNN